MAGLFLGDFSDTQGNNEQDSGTVLYNLTPTASTERLDTAGVLLDTLVQDTMDANDTMTSHSVHLTCSIYDLAIEAIVMGLLCGFGFVGNILSMICLLKDKSKTATPFLLVSLEIADTLLLITVLFLRVLPTVAQYTHSPQLLPMFPYLAKYVFPVALVCQTGTIYMTVLVTINRYFTVCRPYQANVVCSTRSAKKHVIVVWIFAGIYNIPRFLQYEIDTYMDPATNKTVSFSKETDLARHRVYQIVYCNVLYFIVMFLAPLIILCILNSKLVAAFKWTKKKRKQLLAHSEYTPRSEDDITLILIIIVLVFVIFQTPALITQLLVVFLPDQEKACPNAFFYYERISDLLVVANSSINFLIYCFCSRRYRQILVKMMCKNGARGSASPGNSMPNGHTNIQEMPLQTRYTTLSGQHTGVQ